MNNTCHGVYQQTARDRSRLRLVDFTAVLMRVWLEMSKMTAQSLMPNQLFFLVYAQIMDINQLCVLVVFLNTWQAET